MLNSSKYCYVQCNSPSVLRYLFAMNNFKNNTWDNHIGARARHDLLINQIRPLQLPVYSKTECCRSCDCFSCQVKDCSATRILSSSIMGDYAWLTACLMELDVSPFAEVQSAHSKAPVKRAVPHTGDYHKGKIFFNETRTYGPFWS